VRLTADEVAVIKAAATDVFGAGAVVRLFGSRTNDTLVGGDVDLHVEVDCVPDAETRLWTLRDALWSHLRHDKVDILISQRGVTPRGFERVAYRDGIVL
jgi:uncharacterized protein